MSPKNDHPDPPRNLKRLRIVPHRDRLENLFRIAEPALIGYLAALIGSRPIASDLADEAFSQLLDLDSPESIRDFRATLYRIARDLAIGRLEQGQLHVSLHSISSPGGALTTDDNPESFGIKEQEQEQDDFRRAVEDLPLHLKAVYVWSVWDGLAEEAIVDEFAARGNTVTDRDVRRYRNKAEKLVLRYLSRRG